MLFIAQDRDFSNFRCFTVEELTTKRVIDRCNRVGVGRKLCSYKIHVSLVVKT